MTVPQRSISCDGENQHFVVYASLSCRRHVLIHNCFRCAKQKVHSLDSFCSIIPTIIFQSKKYEFKSGI